MGRVFLISSSTSGVPVILELIENLSIRGYTVYNIDLLSGKKRFQNGRVIDLFSNLILNFLYKIPRLRVYVRRFCSKIFINRNIQNEDIVIFHFLDPGYISFIKQISKKTRNIVVHWWGSDLYRSNNIIKNKLNRYFFPHVKRHILVNGMREYFINNFPSETSKIYFAKFGVKLFDVMNSIKENYNYDEIKINLQIPKDKLVISCAYNGSKGQQHSIIVKSLNKLPDIIKSDIFLVFPMTYGSDEFYINEIKSSLSKTNINHIVLTKYMSTEDLAKLKLITDITINIQVTDGFSASIRESLFAGNLLIVGNWLPYQEIKNWGVYYLETTLNNLDETIYDAIINFENYRNKTYSNCEIIYKESSWNNTIDGIIEAYDFQ